MTNKNDNKKRYMALNLVILATNRAFKHDKLSICCKKEL